MRQRRWIELISYYDMKIVYHEGKANVVADALRRKSIHHLCSVLSRVSLREEIEKMGVHVIRKGETTGDLTVEPELYSKIFEKQQYDLGMAKWWAFVASAKTTRLGLVPMRVNGEHKRPQGKVQALEVAEWTWESISMDFIVGLPRSKKGNNMIWVIVDRLTKPAHFIPMKDTWSKAELAKAYRKNVLKLYGIPKDIVSDRDSRFISKFWQEMQESLGTKLKMSTVFYHVADGQTELTIHMLEDMHKPCILEFGGSWEERLDVIEFSYNNSYHANIGMAPFEALYRKKCRSLICWDDISEMRIVGLDKVQEMIEQVQVIRQKMKAAHDCEKSYAGLRRSEIEFNVGDKVLLKVSPMKGVMRFGKRGKLSQKYVGRYEILDRVGQVAYLLTLPPTLTQVHNVFHASQQRNYVSDPSHVLEIENIELDEQLTYEEVLKEILNTKVRKTRNCEVALVKVLWTNHEGEEASWETEASMSEKYPHIFTMYSFFGLGHRVMGCYGGNCGSWMAVVYGDLGGGTVVANWRVYACEMYSTTSKSRIREAEDQGKGLSVDLENVSLRKVSTNDSLEITHERNLESPHSRSTPNDEFLNAREESDHARSMADDIV
ncbi:uncharacterized protein LOC141627849 [Silene latifolia]|uniref:uncharacterized protein LOC141627849 n=1 Tax=Silene latifolia TaxID=37657 RepID=UPI003D78ADAF